MRKVLAVSLLAIALGIAAYSYGPHIQAILVPQPSPPPPHPSPQPPLPHSPALDTVKRLLSGHPQRSQLSSFYQAVATLLPRLHPVPTGAQFREMLERSVRLRFADEFQRVPGLAEAIHGKDGAIAQLYGTEAGPLDIQKMQAALYAVAQACK